VVNGAGFKDYLRSGVWVECAMIIIVEDVEALFILTVSTRVLA
jgi:hypothetical protein